MPQTGKDYSLYFHIPFCHRKCDYCHFFVIPNQDRFHSPFLSALKKQWDLRLPMLPMRRPTSIYFGGGTPSTLSPQELEQILSWTGGADEITLEANPDQMTRKQLLGYQKVGINRLSIGVQSFDNTLLGHLSRTHSAEHAISMIKLAADCGFDNISIDLMYDIPHQTLEQWEATLHIATSLPISHVSLYNLTIEPQTVFFKRQNTLVLPDQEVSLAMLDYAVEHLEQHALARYEISAFGRPSQHNLGYWTDRPFLGYGPSAFSDWDQCRFRNLSNFWRYIKQLDEGTDPIDFEERLLPEARERERVAVGLRVLAGVETELDLSFLVEAGWLSQEGKRYCLTKRGLQFYDSVAVEVC